MPTFSVNLPASNAGIYTFTFDPIYIVAGETYIVFVTDTKNRLHRFNMVQQDGLWVIANTTNLPDWIIALEVELAKAIVNH